MWLRHVIAKTELMAGEKNLKKPHFSEAAKKIPWKYLEM